MPQDNTYLYTRIDTYSQWFDQCLENIQLQTPVVRGVLTRISGLALEARGIHCKIGTRCEIIADSEQAIEAEVVGFSSGKTFLMAMDKTHECSPGMEVIPKEEIVGLPVGDELVGHVLDGNGCPLDGKLLPENLTRSKLTSHPINPLMRSIINEPLDVGVRSINSLLTIGRGQRIGLIAPSGVGKSVLLSMMTRYTNADITVIGLIGERGREVSEFLHHTLNEQSRKQSVVIAAPADYSPLNRVHAAQYATSVAEYFRSQGKHVLLLMDSLTRYAQAHREISLSVGEPPVSKGYPPSVFAKIPELVERAGMNEDGSGSITAFYTVLAENDDLNDPVVDSARSVLDGHITLSRDLAEYGHYPAIDIEKSISRIMNNIVSKDHIKLAQVFRSIYSKYEENKDVIQLGIYKKGSDEELDIAIALHENLMKFLSQDIDEQSSLNESIESLSSLFTVANE
ncbi:MAG: FliI/YscN family ATPase [Gammaproteobacteria bacterium]|nr:FliI/YscN family ATPase [Gammaproteobacteria bacterium]